MTTSVTDQMVLAALQAYISETGTVESRDGDLLHIDHEGMRAALEAALRSQGKVVEVSKLAPLVAKWEAYRRPRDNDYQAGIEDGMDRCAEDLTAIIGEGD
jgi:hypothetical protein